MQSSLPIQNSFHLLGFLCDRNLTIRHAKPWRKRESDRVNRVNHVPGLICKPCSGCTVFRGRPAPESRPPHPTLSRQGRGAWRWASMMGNAIVIADSKPLFRNPAPLCAYRESNAAACTVFNAIPASGPLTPQRGGATSSAAARNSSAGPLPPARGRVRERGKCLSCKPQRSRPSPLPCWPAPRCFRTGAHGTPVPPARPPAARLATTVPCAARHPPPQPSGTSQDKKSTTYAPMATCRQNQNPPRGPLAAVPY